MKFVKIPKNYLTLHYYVKLKSKWYTYRQGFKDKHEVKTDIILCLHLISLRHFSKLITIN